MDTAREEQYKKTLRAARDKISELAGRNGELRRRLAAPGAPVAIVGMAGTFPGDGGSCDSFRRMLFGGADAVGDIPPSRWDNARWYSPQAGTPGKYYCPKGAFLTRDVFAFDNGFFGISPAEAQAMDPQQRLLLTQSWHALEDAGIPPSVLRGTDAGVFAGFSSHDYLMSFAVPNLRGDTDPYILTGSAFNSAAGRLSYMYDFHGPCETIDTACSSSLVAVMRAVEALRNGDCPVALAGGINLLISPLSYVALCAIRAISVDGVSRAFGDGATGFGRGEGCGFVVLKRLDDAVADGDRLHAVILGGAVGHDGRSAGFTAPSGSAQRRIVERALRNAGVEADDVGYVETHGTGTELGDPIEANALAEVFGARERKLLIGSVKSNIGHLEAAAGIASLIKTVFAVRDGEIPPSLHAGTLSPHIGWDGMSVGVCRERTPWPTGDGRRVAGVSSFGISGTGAHLVVAAPPVEEGAGKADRGTADVTQWRVLPLSAGNDDSLHELAAACGVMFEDGDMDFHAVCSKAGAGREHFAHRLAVCAAGPADAAAAIADWRAGKRNRAVAAGTAKNRVKTVFLYSGQGSQAPGMGAELYRTHPVFRASLDACAEIAGSRPGRPLLDVMFGEDGELLNSTLYTQPAIYAVEAALTDMWRSYGVRPHAVIGHSIGEYAAAYAAGVFSLEEGMEIVLERAHLADAIDRPGLMAAVLADEDTASRFLDGADVDIAAVNGGESIVISGEREAVADILSRMRNEGIEHRELPVSHAFHSPLIEPVLEEYRDFLRGRAFAKPAVRFVSSMNATCLDSTVDWPEYWTRHMRRPVRFADALAAAADTDIFLEIGASPTLTSLCRSVIDGPVWLFSQGPGIPAWKQVSLGLARLYTAGCPVDFDCGLFGRGAAADIPLYPFRETHRRLPQDENTAPELNFGMPDTANLEPPDARAAAGIMRMQVTSMHRLFSRQAEVLGKLNAREPDDHE